MDEEVTVGRTLRALDSGIDFGPNTGRVRAMLERAGRLTEVEADALLRAQRQMLHSTRPTWALRDVVTNAHASGRHGQMLDAERAGRESVTVYDGTRRGEAVAGIVARMAEALVVADLVRPATLALLLYPWRTAALDSI